MIIEASETHISEKGNEYNYHFEIVDGKWRIDIKINNISFGHEIGHLSLGGCKAYAEKFINEIESERCMVHFGKLMAKDRWALSLNRSKEV